MPMKPTDKSRRFRLSSWGNRLVVALLVLLLLGLLGTLVVVGLSVAGVTPGA